jgi:membrane associated rhomboid family serine protease
MGIYDRDYYRRDGPSFLAAITERGKVCKWLILINIVVFVLQLVTRSFGHASGEMSAGPVTDWLILETSKVLHGQVWRVLTYAFLHDPGRIWHIVFNMLFLWWFGTDVEESYGPREFLAVYLTAAVLGGVGFVVGNVLGYPEGMNSSCLGASGAVMAVMVLCALHFPNRIIYLFFFLPVPIWVFVIFQVAQDAYGLLTGAGGGTAVTVHLAGAAFAFVYYKRHWRLLDILPSLNRRSFRRRPPLRVYREEEPEEDAVSVVSQPMPRELVDEHLEAKLDAVLEKVAKHGQENLTPSEREILQRASEIYRRKRT